MTAALALVLALGTTAPTSTSASATAHAAASQSPAPAPRAVAATTVHELGTIGIGTEPTVDFTIKNDGNAPLEISVAKKLPSPLMLVSIDKTIAPSASGVVRVAIDTFKAGSAAEHHVPVTTNDPAQPTLTFTIKADVRQFIMVTPQASRINYVQYAPEGGTHHIVGAVDDAKMDVVGVESPYDYLKVDWREAKPEERQQELPGRQWQIDVTITKNAPVGPIGGFVIVRTTHPQQPRAFLAVTGFVRPLFAVTPNSVTLRDLKPAEDGGSLFSLVVKNFGAESLELTGASSDITGLTTKIVPTEPGHAWRVEVSMTRPAAGGPFKGTLTLKTASRDVPALTVPIEGAWAAAGQK